MSGGDETDSSTRVHVSACGYVIFYLTLNVVVS
jgi:hypothetical protein